MAETSDEPRPGRDHRTDLADLEDRLGHSFENRELLVRALTHRSSLPEHEEVDEDNQRLEFLGDAALGLAVAEMLFRRDREVDEGALSKRLSHVVRRSALAEAARRADLGAYIRMGKGEVLSGGRDRDSVLADAFEAVLAAVHLDAGFDAVRRVVRRLQGSALEEAIESDRPTDYKSRLQEATQREEEVQPTYRIVDESGPEHDKTFVAEVLVGGEVIGRGRGGAKQEAEQRAAAEAYGRRAEEDSSAEGDSQGRDA